MEDQIGDDQCAAWFVEKRDLIGHRKASHRKHFYFVSEWV
jgi:hypothetical protein